MPEPSPAGRALARARSGRLAAAAVALLGLAFAALALLHVQGRLAAIVQHHETTPARPGPVVGGSRVAELSFEAASARVGRVYLFAPERHLKRLRGRRLAVTLLDARGRAKGRFAGSIGGAFPVDLGSFAFEPGWSVEPGRRYRLRIALPGVPARSGLPLLASPEPAAHRPGARPTRAPAILDHLILGSRPPSPAPWLAGGLLLAGLALAARPARGLVVLPAAGLAAVLSVHEWESSLWSYWGVFWPDEYVAMAVRFAAWMDGRLALAELLESLRDHRNGASFLVPLLLAGLRATGLPYLPAYVLLSALFSAGALLLFARLLRRHLVASDAAVAGLILLAALNPAFLRGFARPLTDAGGAFFAMLFALPLAAGLAGAPRSGAAAYGLAGLTAALGFCTRAALAPLLLVPLALAGLRGIRLREERLGARLAPAAASLVGAGLLAALLEGLDLWGSVEAAREFASRPRFARHFALAPFALCSALALQLAVPLGLLRPRRLLAGDAASVLLLLVLGFSGMLLWGEIVPWLRYWAPMVLPAAGLTGLVLFGRGAPRAAVGVGLLLASLAFEIAFVTLVSGY